ncbi:MAG: hypothetical protein LBC17_04230 [Lactobacillaceae bacterium]|nr:hypothetical protein [Lactobacillaceae bacterium]
MKKIEQLDHHKTSEMLANGYRYVKTTMRTVVLTFDEITFSRKVYIKKGTFRYQVDEELGLIPYARYSQELLFELAEMATRCHIVQ